VEGHSPARRRVRLPGPAPRPPLRGRKGDRPRHRHDARGDHGSPARDRPPQRHGRLLRRTRAPDGHARGQEDPLAGPASGGRRSQRRHHCRAQGGRPRCERAGLQALHLDGALPAARHTGPEAQLPQQDARGDRPRAGPQGRRRRGVDAGSHGSRGDLQRHKFLRRAARGGVDLDRPLLPERHHPAHDHRPLPYLGHTRLRAVLLPHRRVRGGRGVRDGHLRRHNAGRGGGRAQDRDRRTRRTDRPPYGPVRGGGRRG